MDPPPAKNAANAALRARLMLELTGPLEIFAREAIGSLAKHPNTVNTLAKAASLIGFEGPILEIATEFFESKAGVSRAAPPAAVVVDVDLSPVARKRPRDPVALVRGSPVVLSSSQQKRGVAVAAAPVAAGSPPSLPAASAAPRALASSAGAGPLRHAAAAPAPDAAPPAVAAPSQFCCGCCGRVESLAGPPSAGPRGSGRPVAAAAAAAAAPPHRCMLDAHNWEVVLVVDTREISGRTDRSYIRAQLMSAGVPVDVRALAIGDMMWIARRRTWPPGAVAPHAAPQALVDTALGTADALTGAKPSRKDRTAAAAAVARFSADCGARQEFALDFIVERKTVVDLAASIVDGRYYEQKTRLAATGLRVSYVVEGDPSKLGDSGFASLTPKHLTTSMVMTAVANNFHVVSTHSVDATIAWLVRMHGAIAGHFRKSAECSMHCAASEPVASAVPRSDGGRGAGAGSSRSDLASGGGGGGGGGWSSPALRLSQVASSMAADTCNPFALIGRGASPIHMAHPAPRAFLAAASAAKASPRLCCNDRCNVTGRACFPARLRTYDELQAEAARARVLTVRELFGRMLCQVKLMSAERAEAILCAYPTPSLLADAYDALSSDDARAALLKGLVVPGQRNPLGPALSAAVHVLFNSEARYPGAPTLAVPQPQHDAAASEAMPLDAGSGYGGEGGGDEDEDAGGAAVGAGKGVRGGRGRGRGAGSARGGGGHGGGGAYPAWRGRGGGRGGWPWRGGGAQRGRGGGGA